MRIHVRVDPDETQRAAACDRACHAAPSADGAGMITAQDQRERTARGQRAHALRQVLAKRAHSTLCIAVFGCGDGCVPDRVQPAAPQTSQQIGSAQSFGTTRATGFGCTAATRRGDDTYVALQTAEFGSCRAARIAGRAQIDVGTHEKALLHKLRSDRRLLRSRARRAIRKHRTRGQALPGSDIGALAPDALASCKHRSQRCVRWRCLRVCTDIRLQSGGRADPTAAEAPDARTPTRTVRCNAKRTAIALTSAQSRGPIP